jgi:methylmalonyl-CoA mutase cobalamin-binding domain/chain
VPRIVDGLREAGLDDALVIVGGIIPEGDFAALHEAGADRIFTPGEPLANIVSWLSGALDEREERVAGQAG